MSNIDIQKSLNKLVEDMNKLLEKQIPTNQINLNLLKNMVESIAKINFSNSTTQLEELNSSLEETAETVGKASESLENGLIKAMKESTEETASLSEQAQNATKKIDKLGLAGANAMDGFISGARFSMAMLKSFSRLATGVAGAMFNVGKSIIAAPFKMLSSLLSSSTGGSNELAQAIENVRKEFGNLHESSGKAILDIARGMKGQLANTGLSVYRVFGNLAERLATIAEYAKNMGPLFGVLAGQLVKNAEAVGAYYKGLGLTAEGQKAVGARAYASGTQIVEITREMANYSLQLGKAFGLSSKEISRDVGNMMGDFTHFGHLGVKELSQISVYARKLGIEVKSLGAVLDKFANFEDAATGAAQLSQAFGLNIDAIALMKEQDGAKKVEMLRKAFFAAGRSVENMTYQERRLLAAQSGVTEENLALVFSLKNQGISYADITKKGDQAHKHQLTQTEALKKLGDQIERLVKSGGGGASSFFEIWVKGFKNGITWSKEFRGLMRNLHVDMRTTFQEGRKVGRMFVESFPGVKQFLGGLRDLFNPGRFRAMVRGTTQAFKTFFSEFTNPTISPADAVRGLLNKLKNVFTGWFKGGSNAGGGMLDGVKTFFLSMSSIMGVLLESAIKGVAKALNFLTNLIKNPSGAISGLKGGGGFIARLLGPMIEAIKESGPSLLKAFKEMGGVLLGKVKTFLKNHWVGIVSFLFGPAVIGAAFRGIPGLLLNSLGGGGGASAAGSIVSVFSKMGTLGAAALGAAVVAGFIFFPDETQRMLDQVVSKVSEFSTNAGIALVRFFGDDGARRIFNGFVKATEALVITLPQAIINGLLNGMRAGLQEAMPEYAAQIDMIFDGIRSAYGFMFDMIKSSINTLILPLKAVLAAIDMIKGRSGINASAPSAEAEQRITDQQNRVARERRMAEAARVREEQRNRIAEAARAAQDLARASQPVIAHGGSSIFGSIRQREADRQRTRDLNESLRLGQEQAIQRRETDVAAARLESIHTATFGPRSAASIPAVQIPTPAIPNVARITEAVTVTQQLNTAMTAIAETHETAALPVIARMVADTNAINQNLSQIRPINLNANLTRLGDALGHQERFTVNHRDFAVNVQLNVKIDAADMEKILIERPGTRFTNNSSG